MEGTTETGAATVSNAYFLLLVSLFLLIFLVPNTMYNMNQPDRAFTPAPSIVPIQIYFKGSHLFLSFSFMFAERVAYRMPHEHTLLRFATLFFFVHF